MEQLTPEAKRFFIEPVQKMKIENFPNIIQNKCDEFVKTFKYPKLNSLNVNFNYNSDFKESDEILLEITKEILYTL